MQDETESQPVKLVQKQANASQSSLSNKDLEDMQFMNGTSGSGGGNVLKSTVIHLNKEEEEDMIRELENIGL